MMDNVMLDLETLDSRETAVILSIGAVRFSLDELKTREEWLQLVDPVTCQEKGLTIGADTVRWWMQQSPGAQLAAFSVGGVSLPVMLQRFTNFIREVPNTKVWGNGATFDNMIMRNAYRACNLETPWSFRNDLCFRTMLKMFPQPKRGDAGVRHHALDDARRQAQILIDIWSKIQSHSWKPGEHCDAVVNG